MENKINLEEFLLHQYDETLIIKDRLESKITSYLAVNALMLTVLVTFIAVVESDICKKNFLIIDMVVFCIGIINFVISLIVLFPRRLWQYGSERLLRFHFDEFADLEKTNYSDSLLLQNEKMIYENKKIVNFVRIGYVIVSIGLFIQILGFAFESVLFFKIIIWG